MPATPVIAETSSLFQDVPQTFLTVDATAGASTISVESIFQIAVDNILFIGTLGDENAEIIKTHHTTAATGSTVTLASALINTHQVNVPITVLNYDQVEFSWSATVAGSKTVLATQNIDPGNPRSVYEDSAHSSGFYFFRFKNSISAAFSDYSDPLPFSGWAKNQVGFMIEYSLKRNQVSYSDSLTHDFLLDEADACLQFMNNKLKHWHSLQNFDYTAGQLALGVQRIALPADAWQFSNKSFLNVRVGHETTPLTYIDKEEMVEKMGATVQTTATGSTAAASTTLVVGSVADLPTAGTIMVKGMSITYTGVTAATKTLTGIPASGTGAITATINDGDIVWQGAWSQGQPAYWTVVNGYFLIWPLADASWNGHNLITDYWKDAPSVDSDSDTIDKPRSEAVKHWLVWVVRSHTKNNGKRDPKDTDYLMFNAILNDSISMELKTHGQKNKWNFNTNRMLG